MSSHSHTFSPRLPVTADSDLPSFSLRRIVGQTLLALSLLLTLAVYNGANPQNSSPANSNAPSTMIREFE